MKKAFAIGAVIVLLVFGLLIIYSIGYFKYQGLNLLQGRNVFWRNGHRPEYHFSVIGQADDTFWQSVKEGCLAAAEEFNVAVEFNVPRFTNLEEQLMYLDIAIASKVDGIITHVLDEEKFTPLIDKAVDSGIPVITIEAEAKESKRNAYVGTNTFNLGREAGKLVLEAKGEKANIAIILSDYIDGAVNVPQNLRIAGTKDTLKDMPGMTIKTFSSSTGFFSAEEVTRRILIDYPEIDTIICTSSKDTISAAQIIVDLNKVGQITLIGYDDAPEILRYIEKGVIYGTVVANPYEIGYESIKTMIEIKKDRMTTIYVDTGAKVVTYSNIGDYIDKLAEISDKEQAEP
ncbi:MAG TPA: sugar ABC transporter substrate-binding protein [Clostridiaceae bacterium]|nr:sugar ABC transporter substrate-binding protein [Clostridiaceae bacterium]